jgi:hypothetical protein
MNTPGPEPLTSMPFTASADDLDVLLDRPDVADMAVRSLYRKLADDPDLASECETTLRELHGKRSELARLVGLAALVERRHAQASSNDVSRPAEGSAVDDSSPTEIEPEATAVPVEAVEQTGRPTSTPSFSQQADAAPVVPVSQRQLDEFIAIVTAPSPPPRPRPDDRTFLLALATHVNIAYAIHGDLVREAIGKIPSQT